MRWHLSRIKHFGLATLLGCLTGYGISSTQSQNLQVPIIETAQEGSLRSLYKVSGDSMLPLLQSGEKVWISRTPVPLKNLSRGSVIALQPYQHKSPLIKRVVALPGDHFHVNRQDGTLAVNDRIVRNSGGDAYVFRTEKRGVLSRLEDTFNGRVPEESLIVLGDQSSGTYDSTVFGFVGPEEIIGIQD